MTSCSEQSQGKQYILPVRCSLVAMGTASHIFSNQFKKVLRPLACSLSLNNEMVFALLFCPRSLVPLQFIHKVTGASPADWLDLNKIVQFEQELHT